MHIVSNESGILRTEITWNVNDMKTVTKIEIPNLAIFLWYKFLNILRLSTMSDAKCSMHATRHLMNISKYMLVKHKPVSNCSFFLFMIV